MVSADLEVIFGNDEVFLERDRCFDQGGDEARTDMPLDMAVKEPDA